MAADPHLHGLHDAVVEDLKKSGLEPHHINASMMTGAECGATNTMLIGGKPPVGYVIPYNNFDGTRAQFYRVRLLEYAAGVKYKQPAGTPNHIYFPPGLNHILKQNPSYILLTEGEKKAAAACKFGFPAVAVSGVDSWRNRTLMLPKETELSKAMNGEMIMAKLPSGFDAGALVGDVGPLAHGFTDLVDYLVAKKMQILICFDTDRGGVKTEVQRAAARLAYELRFRGLPVNSIRQLILPGKADTKVGLDDYLVKHGATEFAALVRETKAKRVAFPRHPNPKAFVAKRMQLPRLTRKETQEVALAVLMELDSRGRRLRTAGTDNLHYFDDNTHTLMEVVLANPKAPLHETSFGAYLYSEFGLGANDRRPLEWLATLYTGEGDVATAETHKVITRPKDMPGCIAYQTSDSHFCIVTPDPDNPLIVCENGSHGILFEQGQVKPMDPHEVEVQFYKHLDRDPKNYWLEVLQQMNFAPPEDSEGEQRIDEEQARLLPALLYYISPWLHRWRGTQLPLEMIIGEAGSGKSSVYGMRQQILTGKTQLANMTMDIRDWYASITTRGGLQVLDNVHFTASARDYRQRLSDELCRLITEPEPHVEMRKLYTTSEVASMPIHCTFAMTAIEQPFFNTDLIQRSAIFRMQAIKRAHDASWANRQMARAGGRIGWVGHHLEILHRFLNLAIHENKWNPNYAANNRLANYEQSLVLMAQVFGVDHDWIPDALVHSTEEQMSEADWVLQGLTAFADEMRSKYKANDEYLKLKWTAQDIASWAERHENFSKIGKLVNAWSLGHYLRGHVQMVERQAGLYESGKHHNRNAYQIRKKG